MKIAITKKQIINFANIIFVFYAMLYGLVNEIPTYFRILVWVTIILLMLVSQSLKIKNRKHLIPLILITVSFVIFRNHELANGSYMMTLRWLFCMLYMILLAEGQYSYQRIMEYISKIGFINVIATFLFWIFPSLYNIMYKIWGYWPTGTRSGTYGYRAALTNHYSQNGIVCIITAISLFSLLLSKQEISKKKKQLYFILFVLSVFAVILTTKRAHLLFGGIAMLFVYYFCNPKEMVGKTFKIIIGALFACLAIYVGATHIPEVQNTLSRFLTIGVDTESLSRYEFWGLAIKLFLESPVFGIGWLGFRYQYNTSLFPNSARADRYEYLNCHNVYIQLLCETGIVGLLVYLILVISLLIITFSLLKKTYRSRVVNQYRNPLFFSAVIQVFYLLYSFTGNCLYDITFCYFCVAAAISLGCNIIYINNYKQDTCKVISRRGNAIK